MKSFTKPGFIIFFRHSVAMLHDFDKKVIRELPEKLF